MADQTPPDKKGMTAYAKGAAYTGLALVTPISGWLCYKAGQYLDARMSTSWAALAGLVIGCAAGMYETYREGLRIEGLTALVPKSAEKDGKKPE